MRQLWVWMLLMALAFVNDRCHCCLQEERSSLLEIKAWFGSAGAGLYDPSGWNKEDFNCCNWDYRVACDNTTKRVIELDFSSVNYYTLEDLYLNASLFLPFKELKTLDLSSNQLVGGLKNQGFQALASGLRKLKFLNLSDNKFNDSILSSLNGFSTLESLDLSGNRFTGTIDLDDNFLSGFQGLASGLRKLKELRLRNNKFNDIILSSLSGFSTLESLDLSNNSFTGTIGLSGLRKLEFLNLDSIDFKENILLESLGGLPTLKTLIARESTFEGKHFGKGLCNSTSLEEMFLQDSSLPASFLENIGTTLKVLSLIGVDFHNTLPAQALQNLTKLEELFLDGASLITTSFLRIIGPLPALRTLSLKGCMLNGTLPHQGWCELKNLEGLYLSRNNLKGVLPSCLGNLSSLRYLDLSDNQFSGLLPYAFFNLSSLVTLDLDDNNLTGPIPDWIDSLSDLSIFVLRSNQFNGELPHQLCLLRRLRILDLSKNIFSGHLPSCLSNLNFTESRFVYYKGSIMYNRDFLGDEMEEINVKIVIELTSKKNFYTYMSAVDLSCNRFTGEIPIEWGYLSGIHSLNLSQNNLTGLIPSSFSNLKQIESLDLSNNNLNGRIPAQLIELTFLAVFNVSYNNLSGKTPERNQFGTFDESSYKANPLLCGPPLGNSCEKTESPSERVPDNSNGDDGSIDMDSFYVSFYVSFGVCYIIVVLTILAVLCINPHWRRRWFYFIEKCIDTCYCVLAINFRKFFKSRR